MKSWNYREWLYQFRIVLEDTLRHWVTMLLEATRDGISARFTDYKTNINSTAPDKCCET